MKRKLEKIFEVFTPQEKVYQVRGRKKAKQNWWKNLYSLFF